jgi:3D (Asp-Asp-Asp) domain-containing protein
MEPLLRKNTGFVAAPPSLSMGTVLSVPGYHGGPPVQVLDRGGMVQGNHLDLFMPTHAQALQWGVRRIPVTLY